MINNLLCYSFFAILDNQLYLYNRTDTDRKKERESACFHLVPACVTGQRYL